MLEEEKINNRIRKILLAVIALTVFGLSLWVYSVTYATIDIKPNEQQIISSKKPTISVDWPYAYGARLKKARVYLDGKEISNKVQVEGRGFTFRSKEDMSEGVHVIDAELVYNLLVERKVSLKWFFSTDTVRPRIILNERDDTLASSTPQINIKGETEPLSTIEARLENDTVVANNSGKEGKFNINFSGLKKNNKLLLVAKDRAGNITKRNLNVLIDTEPPVIKKVVPSEGQTIFSAGKDRLRAALFDNESSVSNAVFKINGKMVKSKFDKKKDVIAYIGSFKKDGEYKAQIDVYDLANNKTSKSWNFIVDTGKIIVDQSDFKLYYYKGDKLDYSVSVAVGMARFPTPNGLWKIINKKSMPVWYNPRKSWSASMPARIAPGPRNPLGVRALYLNASGIRIHGTSAYYSIGRRASHGCIRVRNVDIVTLFPKVSIGTPAIVRP